ncbi:MAG: hypothetical protein V4549_00070 [Bacteroidota bacterium]
MKNIILFLFVFLVSCNAKKETKSEYKLSIKDNWNFIRVIVDNHRFLVTPDKDTLFYMNHDNKKVTLIDSASGVYDDKNVSVKYFLSKSDRDSLLSYCYQAIVNPVITDKKVTCYAGQYVLISIEKAQIRISCNYSSIENWQTISPILKNIERLTFGKLKKE